MSQHAAYIVRDHCLAPERVDAPVYGGRYRSLFEALPSLSRSTRRRCTGSAARVDPATSARQRRSSRMSTRGNPLRTESVSAAFVNPARSKSPRVPT
jgi:hypothetical protein